MLKISHRLHSRLIVSEFVTGEADQAERDSRSIFIGNVDFATSVEEVNLPALLLSSPPSIACKNRVHLQGARWQLEHWLQTPLNCVSLRVWCVQVQALFADCGEINAITIPVDKYTGRAKGFAYLEFAAKVMTPMSLDARSWSSLFVLTRSLWAAGVGVNSDGEKQRPVARSPDQGGEQANKPPSVAGTVCYRSLLSCVQSLILHILFFPWLLSSSTSPQLTHLPCAFPHQRIHSARTHVLFYLTLCPLGWAYMMCPHTFSSFEPCYPCYSRCMFRCPGCLFTALMSLYVLALLRLPGAVVGGAGEDSVVEATLHDAAIAEGTVATAVGAVTLLPISQFDLSAG
jgi:hypothetical protein